MSLADHFKKHQTNRQDLNRSIIKNLSSGLGEKSSKEQPLTGALTPEELYAISAKNRALSLNKFSSGNIQAEQLIVNTWRKAVEVRRQYMVECDRLQLSPIASAILDLVVQDVLNADDHGEIIEFKSSKPAVDRELKLLQKRHNFNKLLSELTRNFIDFGEFTLATEYVLGEGLVEISDNIDQINVLAFYDASIPSNFLVLRENQQFEVAAPYEYAHFVMGHNKLRILLRDQLEGGYISRSARIPDSVREELPDYVRIGRPFFLSTLEHLEQLEILGRLIPAMKLNELVSPNLVAIKMPPMDPIKAMAACKTIEQVLNIPINVDVVNSTISIPDLVSQSARWKAIPDMSPEKGHLEALNARSSTTVDDILKALSDYRSALLSQMGLPPSLMFPGSANSDADAEKSKELRIYGRYARKLGNIRRCLVEGLMQMCLGHLVNRGFTDITHEDVDITFKFKLADLSGLESLELDDAKQAIVSNSVDFVNKILGCKFLANALKQKVLMEYVNNKFRILTDGVDMFDLDFEELPIEQLMPIAPGANGSGDMKDDPFVDIDDDKDSVDKKGDDAEID